MFYSFVMPKAARYFKKVTPRERSFALHYLMTGNATQSYIEAGYTAANRDVARKSGHKLLHKEKIQALLTIPLKAQELTNERLTEEIMQIAFGNPVDELSYKEKMKGLSLLAGVRGMLKPSREQGFLSTVNILNIIEGKEEHPNAEIVQVEAPKEEQEERLRRLSEEAEKAHS